YILPDEFLVSAESTVRNLQEGERITERFGGGMKVGYIPDSFGHIAMMPAILKGFGIDTAILYRGFGGEPGQDVSEYSWRSPDGTECLLVHLHSNGYSTGYFHQESDDEILRRFKPLKAELDARATTSQRLLLNGGDHHWPDPRLPRTLDLLRENFKGDYLHSTLPRFVEALKKEINSLRKIEGELRFGYRYAFAVLGGVYSSRMYLKQQNWSAQTLLERYVEPIGAFAALLGARSQRHLTRQAWKTLMQNHPHDSICGCSIDPVHSEMMTRFKAVEDLGMEIVEESLKHLVPYDDQASRDDRCLILFNPSPFPRSEVAEAELGFYLQDVVVGLNPDVHVATKLPSVSGFALLDADDREVPYQVLRRSDGYDITKTRYNYPKQTAADRFWILLDTSEVPPMGFRSLRVERRERFPRYSSNLKTGRNFLENPYLRVEVNSRGEVKVRDKRGGKTYSGLNVFEDGGDVGDEYNYSYPKKDREVLSTGTRARVSLVEKGPLRAALRIQVPMSVPHAAAGDRKSRSKKSATLHITSTVTLTSQSKSVQFETTVLNTAEDHRLRVLFPSAIKTRVAHADSQFCVVERVQRRYDTRKFKIEHPAAVAPMQRFVAVKDKRDALLLFSHGLPEYELSEDGKGTLALTLLRCVGLLAGGDLITRPGGRAGWYNETPDAQCQGTHTFRYALLPCSAAEFDDRSLVNEESERFHLPLLPIRRKNTEGIPETESFLEMTPASLTLSAVKESEEGKHLVVRFYNSGSEPIEGGVRFAFPIVRAWETRLDERPLREVEVQGDHTVPVRVQPRALLTVMVETGPGARRA
ncbi:MAG: glycoside hydrolase family 38 C-terminal domain-containing protein, partial [Bacteroidota bacterium]